MASEVLLNTRDSRSAERDMNRGIYTFYSFSHTKDINVTTVLQHARRIGIVQEE